MDQNMNASQIPPAQGQTPNQGSQKNIGMAVIAYILFFIPLLTDAKNDPFVKYHVKQGLLIFIGSFVSYVVSWLPVIGWATWFLNLAILVLFVMGIINAVTEKEKPLPVIGHLAEKFHF